MKDDPVIDRVREARRKISERFGHDPEALTQYYIEKQRRHADRLVRSDKSPEASEVRDSD